MEFSRHISRILHEEHRETIAAMEQLDGLVAGRRKAAAPDVNDPAVRASLQQVCAIFNAEVGDHFGFEENELFTRLAEYGDVAIGAHLTEEHGILLPLGEQVAAVATAALENGFNEESWNTFRQISAELVERMLTHIQKEEMGLLPLLEDVLDSDTDFALTEIYQNSA